MSPRTFNNYFASGYEAIAAIVLDRSNRIGATLLERQVERGEVLKANGLGGRVVRVMDHSGLFQRVDGADAIPSPAPRCVFSGLPLQLADIEDNSFHVMLLPQARLEASLEERVRELGVDIHTGADVRGFVQDDEGVTVNIESASGPRQLRSRFLVGADGARSIVRKQAGIGFPGATHHTVSRLAHVDLPESMFDSETATLSIPGFGDAHFGFNHTPNGILTLAILGSQGPMLGTIEWDDSPPGDDVPVTLDEIRDSVRGITGADIPLKPPTTPGPPHPRRTNTTNTRLADSYRRGRVLLVGDAAHVHSAIGGPGLNLGLQDAVNLGWKLAAHVTGRAPERLLDAYHSERYPAGQRVMTLTMARLALMSSGVEVAAMREVVGEPLDQPHNAGHIASTLAGSAIRYDMGEDHRLTGRFVPDLAVGTQNGQRRVAELMRRARPVLLDFTTGGDYARGGGLERPCRSHPGDDRLRDTDTVDPPGRPCRLRVRFGRRTRAAGRRPVGLVRRAYRRR